MRHLRWLCIAGLLGISALHAAPIDVNIDRTRDRFNLGLSDFFAEDKTEAGLVSSYQSVIADDLNFSKLFNLLQKGPQVKKKNDVTAWAALGSDVVLWASVRSRADKLEISVKLNDTRSGKEVLSVTRRSARSEMRTHSHEIANEVVKYFTGQSGFFTSKLVFSNDATGRKELYIADYDGKNMKRLTNDNSIVILPRISPDGNKIIFTSYVSGNPDLYAINRDGTGRKKLSSKPGLNVSPSWTPDSQNVAITLSHAGPPNIYLIDAQTGEIKQRLTDAQTADTAPTFSPDGNQIAFTSDRAGAPHIYMMNIDGSGLRRITTASHCDSAAWSPDGQIIVYVKGEEKGFDIYSIEVLTGLERRLTWGQGDNENPSWSPDGRFILFTSTRRGKPELFVMSADGSDQKVIPTNNAKSYTPHWSH